MANWRDGIPRRLFGTANIDRRHFEIGYMIKIIFVKDELLEWDRTFSGFRGSENSRRYRFEN